MNAPVKYIRDISGIFIYLIVVVVLVVSYDVKESMYNAGFGGK
jgi:hypothetical protein